MIVLLLSCFTSYCQSNTNSSSTGEYSLSDSTVVIPISFIKKANEKLIQIDYLNDVIAQQDTLISDYNNYISVQKEVIKEFQDKVLIQNEINNSLRKSINNKKRINKILLGTTGVFLTTTVLSFIIN